MSDNNSTWSPSAGNNNKKRKTPTYLSVDDDTSGQKKRPSAPQHANTPVMKPPTQPAIAFGYPQMGNPAVYGSPKITLFVAMRSTAVLPQFQQSEAPFQPQAQHPQPQPQHVPQPGGYQPGFNMYLTPGFYSMGLAAGQQQTMRRTPVDTPRAGNSLQYEKKKTNVEVVDAQDAECRGWGPFEGTLTKLTIKGRPGQEILVTQTSDPNMTISRFSGDNALDVIDALVAHHQSMHHGDSRIITRMRSVPLRSDPIPGPSPGSLPASNQPLVSTERGGRRQKPRKPEAQAPPLPPAQAQPQVQENLPCPNCNRSGHLVGDCVGPPNKFHGDLPACSVCDSFGGRVIGVTDSNGHRLDDCQRVHAVFHRLQRDMDCPLEYQDLANLTNDELEMFYTGLCLRRVRKVPIRTRLVCWIDIIREIARRFHGTDVISLLGNMSPWTKAFALEQNATQLAKPWDFYDYAAGNIQSLPACPTEQVNMSLQDFVANGLPDVPPQVFSSGDRLQRADKIDVDNPSEVKSEQPQDSQVILDQPRHPQQQRPQQLQAQPFGPVQVGPQKPPQTDTTAWDVEVPPPRSFGDDVAPLRTPPMYGGSSSTFSHAVSGMGQGPSSFQAPSSSRPGEPSMTSATPSIQPSEVRADAGIVPSDLPPPSALVGTSDTSHVVALNFRGVPNDSASPAPNDAGQGSHDRFRDGGADPDAHSAFMNMVQMARSAKP